MTSNLMVWLIAAPALATIVIPALGSVRPKWRPFWFTLAHVGFLVLAVLAMPGAPARILVEVQRGPRDAQLGLVLDQTTALALVLTALLFLVLSWFTDGYVRGVRLGTTFLSLLLLQQAAVNLTLLAGDLLALYAGLLTLSIALMLMIGLDFGTAGGAAALRVFATLEVPAALAFVGFWLIDARAGTVSLANLAREANWENYPSSWMLIVPIAIALIARAGLVPLQNWVVTGCRAGIAPGAVALAGIALPVGGLVVSRLAGVAIPLDSSGLRGLMLLGGATAVVAGIGALRENAALGWLGYLALGQVGLATVGFASGNAVGRQAALLGLAATALGVTLVGMGIGLAIRAAQQTHFGVLADLSRAGIVRYAVLLGALAFAPLPPFAGFTSRRLLLASLLGGGSDWDVVAAAVAAVGTLLLATAVWRAAFGFLVPSPSPGIPIDRSERTGDSGPVVAAPAEHRARRADPAVSQTVSSVVAMAVLVVASGLVPASWLSGGSTIGAVLPQSANLLATGLLFLAVGAAPIVQYVAARGGRPQWLARILAQNWRRWRLDLALDPYVLVGGSLLLMGRLSALTLDRTLGRLARAR